MPDIEFDDDPADWIGAERPAVLAVAVEKAERLAIGLVLVSAVLCLVAPFQHIYTYHGADRGFDLSPDGWGRFDGYALGQHGPRDGVALYAAAAALLVVAVLRGRAMLNGWASSVPRLLPATVGLFTGVLGSVLIDLQATVDNVRESNAGSNDLDEVVALGASYGSERTAALQLITAVDRTLCP